MRKLITALLVILLYVPLLWFIKYLTDPLTCEKYGKNIVYYDFTKIPDDLALDRKIELPRDLKEFLEYKWNNPRIEDPLRFEQDFWQEVHNLGYNLDKLKNASVKEAIMASVKIVASRFTYYYVDKNKDFIKQYGEFLPIDIYFHLKLGDCDKYRDAVIGVFNIIKGLNPRLQNIYLSISRLGGNSTFHAWVSIVIPYENCLILSHIDPTLYDRYKSFLEANEFHICLKHDIFIAYFDKALNRYKNFVYAYQILEGEFPKIKSKEQREIILNDMSDIVLSISFHSTKEAIDKIHWVLGVHKAEGFTKNLDSTLYCAFRIYSRAGNKLKAEKYKQRLLKEFPNSWLSKHVRKKYKFK